MQQTQLQSKTYPIERNFVASQHLRTDERHLVPQIRIAALVTSREIRMGHSFEFTTVCWGHGVPRLGLAKVQKVDRVQVHVFGVPCKGGLPHAKVEVGRVYAVNLDAVVVVDVVENCAEMVDVPFLGGEQMSIKKMITVGGEYLYLAFGIGDATADVRPVDGCRVRNVLPVFFLQIFVVHVRRCCVAISFAEFGKLFDIHRLLLDVDLLVEAGFAGDHLADGRRDRQRYGVQVVATFSRHPFFRRNYL